MEKNLFLRAGKFNSNYLKKILLINKRDSEGLGWQGLVFYQLDTLVLVRTQKIKKLKFITYFTNTIPFM